jgi:hypothetical protein
MHALTLVVQQWVVGWLAQVSWSRPGLGEFPSK